MKTPKSTEDVLQPKLETVSATPNKGQLVEAHDATTGVGHAEGDIALPGSVDCGDCCLEQFAPAKGALPVRTRTNKPEGGSIVTSETQPTPPYPDEGEDAARVKLFTRGGQDRIAQESMSSRDWNSAGAAAQKNEAQYRGRQCKRRARADARNAHANHPR